VADSLRLEVPEALADERLDRALATLLDVSRAQARDLVDRGVKVDGKPAKPSDRVSLGAIIESPRPLGVAVLTPEAVDFEVLHEDQHLIVVDKPPGMVVHPGAGTTGGTLVAGLLHRYPDLQGVGDPGRWGLVHRLDRDTSGVLLVGRTQRSFERLRADLAERRIGRVYTAMVSGIFATQTGTIDAPIGRDPARPTRRAVIPGGKPAITHYEVVTEFPMADLTLVEVRLETGRTHQIRVHMTAIGHPVLADRLYATSNTRVKSPRIFLHARRVELRHPETDEAVAYEAPLPGDLVQVLEELAQAGPGNAPSDLPFPP
jgi:23S rRNA pseudouridine1911/1915/1917 synthase